MNLNKRNLIELNLTQSTCVPIIYVRTHNLTKGKEVMVNEDQSRRVLGGLSRLGNSCRILPNSNIKENIMSKEKAKVVKQTKTHVFLEVPAYSDDKLVGWAKATIFQLNAEGLKAAKASLTLSNVNDINRQELTDVKNNLRRGTSAIAELRKLSKENPVVEKLIEVILKKAQDGTLTDAFLKSLGV